MVSEFQNETKNHSFECCFKDEPKLKQNKKPYQSRSKLNALVNIFLDCQGVVHYQYFNRAIDSFLCLETVPKLSEMQAANSWTSHDNNTSLHVICHFMENKPRELKAILLLEYQTCMVGWINRWINFNKFINKQI